LHFSSNLRKEDKNSATKVSFIQKFHCILFHPYLGRSTIGSFTVYPSLVPMLASFPVCMYTTLISNCPTRRWHGTARKDGDASVLGKQQLV